MAYAVLGVCLGDAGPVDSPMQRGIPHAKQSSPGCWVGGAEACVALTTPWMTSHPMDDCCARGGGAVSSWHRRLPSRRWGRAGGATEGGAAVSNRAGNPEKMALRADNVKIASPGQEMAFGAESQAVARDWRCGGTGVVCQGRDKVPDRCVSEAFARGGGNGEPV